MTEEIEIVNEEIGQQVRAEFDSLLENIAIAENKMECGYARLGFLLSEISKNQYYKPEYRSFNDFLAAVGEKYNRGRTILYNYFSTVRELGEYVDEQQLTTMGISKARELCKVSKQTGLPPSPDTISQAVDPAITTAALRQILHKANNIPEQPQGVFVDIGGFMCTLEEKQTIWDAIHLAWRIDPVVSESLPAPIRIKEALLRMAMTFLGSEEVAQNDEPEF